MSIESMNRFVKNPVTMDMPRSRFKRPFTHKTTFMSGKLIPVFCDEVLPGDTFDLKWSTVLRMLTPAVPVMDNSFLDMYFFFVPNRLCTYAKDDWQKIVGENLGSYWAPSSESTLSNTSNTTSLSGRSVSSGSVANYLGLPIGTSFGANWSSLPISLLPFNAYIRIWNEWFRDENTQPPKPLLYGGSSETANLFTGCYDVNRLHDYFTSALPAPQKGASVLLPIVGAAPVKTSSSDSVVSAQPPVKMRYGDGTQVTGDHWVAAYAGASASDPSVLVAGSATPAAGTGTGIYFSNLYADLANATAASVNEMRQAFAIQRLLEADARGGTRFREILKAHFGVTIPDLTVQVPEYLGGKRIPLNITQVLATAQDSSQSVPLGKTGAFSNTAFSDYAFRKSFTEWGFIMGVCCVRTEQSYSQGIPRMFTRDRRYDWYWSKLANIGEQPIYTRELYAPTTISSSYINQVFGYQEAWADYRYKPNMVTGNLAPNANDTTMTAWTYTNKFTAAPTLNSNFMVQPSSQIGDTLVQTNTTTQFVGDFYFDLKCTREMPLYSIPGLIDHH